MSLFNYIKAQLSILDVVGEYVRLRRAGNYWKGSCPFHYETDASFTVSPDKQIFYCFGCHAGGDLIAFIAKSENLGQLEAVNQLVDKYGINIPDELKQEYKRAAGGTSHDMKERHFRVCRTIATWLHERLLAYPRPFGYLQARGMNRDTLVTYHVGYFPGGPQQVNSFIKDMSNQGVMLGELLELGFLTQSKSYNASPFEERIIFPIKDNMGRYCGFGGRIFDPTDTRPKYYNSKESDVFTKRSLIFGLDAAKKELQKLEVGYLVEGYMDCAMMYQYGYHNTIATLGTACTTEHLRILSRYIKTLFVVYDGDKAGQNAILRLTELCWGVSLDLKVVSLPPKEDPASLLTKGEKLDPLISQAPDIFTFFINSIGGGFMSKSLSEKLEASKRIVEVIGKLDDPFKEDILLQQAGLTMQMPFVSLKSLLTQQKRAARYSSSYAAPAAPDQGQGESAEGQAQEGDGEGIKEEKVIEEKLFAAIINNISYDPRIVAYEKELSGYFSPTLQNLLSKFLECRDQAGPQEAFNLFLTSLDNESKMRIMRWSVKYEDGLSAELFEQVVGHFRKSYWKKVVFAIREDIVKARQHDDNQKVQELLQEFARVKQDMKSKGLV